MDFSSRPLDEPLDPDAEKTLELTEEVATYWVSTAGWAYFFALLCFIFCGLMFLLGINWLRVELGAGLILLGTGIVLLVFGVLLWKFQAKLKKALYDESAELLEQSFRALRIFYILAGVFSILLTLIIIASFGLLVWEAAQPPAYEADPFESE
jgi:hypothetical protein